MNKKELLQLLENVSDDAAIAISAPKNPEARRLWESNVVYHRHIVGHTALGEQDEPKEVFVLYCYDPHYRDETEGGG